jgi:hypothetical protein
MQNRPFPIVASLVAVLLSACVDGQDAARLRASREFECPEDKITTKYIGESHLGELWQVHACGVVATYACKSTSADGVCIRESDDRKDTD